MVRRTQKIFNRLDGELRVGFGRMQEICICSTWTIARGQKRRAGIRSTLSESRLAVHFHERNCLQARRGDDFCTRRANAVFTRSRRAGRGFVRVIAARRLRFCEVASMSMETARQRIHRGILFRRRCQPRAAGSFWKARGRFFRGLRRWMNSSTGFNTHPGHSHGRTRRGVAGN